MLSAFIRALLSFTVLAGATPSPTGPPPPPAYRDFERAALGLPDLGDRAVACAFAARLAHERKEATAGAMLQEAMTLAARAELSDADRVLALANLAAIDGALAQRAYRGRPAVLDAGRLRVSHGGATARVQTATVDLDGYVEALNYLASRTTQTVPGLLMLISLLPVQSLEAAEAATAVGPPVLRARALGRMASRAKDGALQRDLFAAAARVGRNSALSTALLAAQLATVGEQTRAEQSAQELMTRPGRQELAIVGLAKAARTSLLTPADFLAFATRVGNLLDLAEWGALNDRHFLALVPVLRSREEKMPLGMKTLILSDSVPAAEQPYAAAADVLALLPTEAATVDQTLRPVRDSRARNAAALILALRETPFNHETRKLAAGINDGFQRAMTLAQAGPPAAPPVSMVMTPAATMPATANALAGPTSGARAIPPGFVIPTSPTGTAAPQPTLLTEAAQAALAESDPTRRLLAYTAYAEAAMRQGVDRVALLRAVLVLTAQWRPREGIGLPLLALLDSMHPELAPTLAHTGALATGWWTMFPAPASDPAPLAGRLTSTTVAPVNQFIASELRAVNARVRGLRESSDELCGVGSGAARRDPAGPLARYLENPFLRHRFHATAGYFADSRGTFAPGMTAEKGARLTEVGLKNPATTLFLAAQIHQAGDKATALMAMKKFTTAPWFAAVGARGAEDVALGALLDTVATAGKLGDLVFHSATLTPAEMRALRNALMGAAPVPTGLAMDAIESTYVSALEIHRGLPGGATMVDRLSRLPLGAERDRAVAAAAWALLIWRPTEIGPAAQLSRLVTDPYRRSRLLTELGRRASADPVFADEADMKKTLMQALAGLGLPGPAPVSANFSGMALKEVLHALERKTGVPILLEGAANPIIDHVSLVEVEAAAAIQFLAKKAGLNATRLGYGFVVGT